jgi:hypothetical protein
MKGGKGGQGRKRSTQKVSEKPRPKGTVKKGAAKKDWGAIPKDDDEPALKGPASREGT